ncbi:MAG: SDR family oxidoreductase [Phycisphaeraceae bacterium]
MPRNHTAIVIGAGSGIGRALSVLLAESRFDLLLVSRTIAHIEETAQLARHQGRDVTISTLSADVSDPSACRKVIDQAVTQFGRIDAIANVAGYAVQATVEATTPEQWRRMIDTNVSYVMYLTAAVWPVFRQQHSGVIVNVSSMASVDPFPGFAMYASAKVALNMFTRVTADEGKAIGVKAVAVAPGAVETPMLRGLFDQAAVPADRALAPREVARVIRDCITGERAFVSGETILVPSP